MPRYITKFTDDYKFLSNFYRHELTFRGREFPTSEHAYQAMKATEPESIEYVQDAPSPGRAKKRGRKVDLRPDWERVKLDVMLHVLRSKFDDPELAELLEKTWPAKLIEGNDWGDTYWGVCGGAGQNWLGRLLMKVRQENIKEQ